MASDSSTSTVEMYDFVVTKGNGVKGMIESGLISNDNIPDEYIQPLEERIEPSSNSQIPPPIDLSQLDGDQHDEVVEAIAKAAETIGVFQVVNHGAPFELLEKLKSTANQFFNQHYEKKVAYIQGMSHESPEEMLNKLKESPDLCSKTSISEEKKSSTLDDSCEKFGSVMNPSAFVKYGTSFVPDKNKKLEWMDYLNLIYTNDADALQYWPELCKEVALEYIKISKEIGRRILEVLMGKLGVKMDDSMVDAYLGSRYLLMNYYPICPAPELTVGIGRHSDMGTLTILLQDDVGGLYGKQLDIEEGAWLEVPPVPGALVVILGDSLEVLSNGRYKSCEHMASANSKRARVSIPSFMAPRLESKIGPLPQAIGEDGKAQFREYLFEDYFKNLMGKPHNGKVYLDFAKI